MVLAKRILWFSILLFFLATIVIGIIVLLQNNAGAIMDKGVFV